MMSLTFVESLVFSSRWERRSDDDALRSLQNQLMANPSVGRAIPGCSVLRKHRVADPSRGKGTRGGLRVIYMHTPEADRIDLITVYGKDGQSDLGKHELKMLCELAKMLRAQLVEPK